MNHRLLLAALAGGAIWLLSACASAPSDDYNCRPPAYCGSHKTYQFHGEG